MNRLVLAVVCALALASSAMADVLYIQPPNGGGTLITSAYWDPDGSDYDALAWDGFMIPAGANITEIRWRGGYPGGGTTGGNITNFEISIYASIPAGIQPDLGYLTTGPLWHRLVSGNCGETFAGNSGGTNMYDYHYTLSTPFAAAANTRYWVQIIAWQPGWPTWGLATASGGNGSYFYRSIAAVGDFGFHYGSGDAAFTIIGTPSACTNPTITSDPQPVALCFYGGNAAFSAAGSGAGPFTYRWYKNGNPVYDGPNGGGMGGGSFIAGATTASLSISAVSWNDVGTYTCVIANTCGPTTTAGAALSVTAGPAWSMQPVSTSACGRSPAQFSVAATGAGTLVFQWQIETPAGSGVYLPLADGYLPGVGLVAGAASSVLDLSQMETGAGTRYRCIVSNGCASAVGNAATLTVGCPNMADVAGLGGAAGCDGQLSVDDVVYYLGRFFAGDNTVADLVGLGGVAVPDGQTTVDDLVAFLAAFFTGCP